MKLKKLLTFALATAFALSIASCNGDPIKPEKPDNPNNPNPPEPEIPFVFYAKIEDAMSAPMSHIGVQRSQNPPL